MNINCALPLADLLLQAYKADFLQELLKNKDGKIAQTYKEKRLLTLCLATKSKRNLCAQN
jgi:hypothetical protein